MFIFVSIRNFKRAATILLVLGLTSCDANTVGDRSRDLENYINDASQFHSLLIDLDSDDSDLYSVILSHFWLSLNRADRLLDDQVVATIRARQSLCSLASNIENIPPPNEAVSTGYSSIYFANMMSKISVSSSSFSMESDCPLLRFDLSL